MTKTLVCAAIISLAVLNSFGQGSVIFSNAGGAPITINDGITHVPVGSTYQAELMYAPDGTAAADFATMAVRQGNPASFGPISGYFSAGGRTIDSITPPGGFGLFQVRVWATAHGTSYNEVIYKVCAYIGASPILRVDTANPLIGEPNAGLVAAGLTGFNLSICPEPSALALGILGAATLFLLRRRKSKARLL
jgi:MYXO-CTERM domain-containing protein